MLNFGLTEMRLVTPRDGWPNPSAGPAAAGADDGAGTRQVFETLADAVADCAHVYATTVRKRGVTKPVLTPEAGRARDPRAPGRSAIVFGPERSGLETEDVALARAIVTVPINPEFGSLNLAQAVILCAYEWSKLAPQAARTARAGTAEEELLPPAPQDELEGLIAHFEAMLEPRDYFFPTAAPPPHAHLAHRADQAGLEPPGSAHLRGVLSALERLPGRRAERDSSRLW
jgi:tRNA/rRNA methyltransferase